MEGREETEPGIDIEEQPESPLLIAMKGHSSSNKSKIAQELAQFLNFPLIDEEDIIPALQDSLETEHFDDLSFGNSLANPFNPALFEAQCYHQRSALSPRPLWQGGWACKFHRCSSCFRWMQQSKRSGSWLLWCWKRPKAQHRHHKAISCRGLHHWYA